MTAYKIPTYTIVHLEIEHEALHGPRKIFRLLYISRYGIPNESPVKFYESSTVDISGNW